MAKDPFRQLQVYKDVSQSGRKIKDCYRLMYKKELWIKAYAKLSAKQIKRADSSIISGYKLQLIDDIIDQLKKGKFRFSSADRMNDSKIQRKSSKQKDSDLINMLVYEVIAIILNSIYEPVFSASSHSCRKDKSYQTALLQIKHGWNNLTWCLKGDIEANFDYSVLLHIISKKVSDRRFLLLIHNALIHGVMDNWKDNAKRRTSNISSILAHIYWNELDFFIEEQMNEFNKGKTKSTKRCLNDQKSNTNTEDNCKIKYVRYLNEFVIGVAGNKNHAKMLQESVRSFIEQELELDAGKNQLFIRHLNNTVPFIGYQFQRHCFVKNPACLNEIKLEIPKEKLMQFAKKNSYGNLTEFKSAHRTKIVHLSEREIMNIFNFELKEIANYYELADNYHHLNKLFHLAKSSYIKTIANKRRSTSKKVIRSLETCLQSRINVKKSAKVKKRLSRIIESERLL